MMSFRRKNFAEVFDNIMTSVGTGVSGESHPFPPNGQVAGPFEHALLSAPVSSVVSVYGTRDGISHLFRSETDYTLKDASTLVWKESGARPDEGTLFEVSYYPESAGSPLTRSR